MVIELVASMKIGEHPERMAILFSRDGVLHLSTCTPQDLNQPREAWVWSSIPLEVVRRLLTLEIPG